MLDRLLLLGVLMRAAACAALLAAFGAGAATPVAQADTGPSDREAASPAPATRPRVALVLSGGGARGFAHVGVLRALHDMRVPVDAVVGVSMGAVVGSAYAAGRTVDELERFVRGTDWTGVVADRPARDDLAFRRREDDLIVPSRIEFGIGRSGVVLPPGTAGNTVLESALLRLLPAGTSDTPVHELPLPFRSVASDLLTGELVELKDTPLFMSVRASLAVPGVFAPVRLNGRLVVDGGLVRNLPVDIAKAMGADVVIAVNVGTPLADESTLTSSIGVARQMLLILTEQNVQRSLKELGPRDVLIAPALDGVSFMDFGSAERALAIGEKAARDAAPQLAALAVTPRAYTAYEQLRIAATSGREADMRLAKVEIHATPHAGAAALNKLFGLREGDVASRARINETTTRLLGRGEFDRIQVDIEDTDAGREVRVKPIEADWARSRLRLGLELLSDFADDHRITLGALHTLPWVNTWGGEWRTLARVGSQRSFLTQLWQPLTPGSDWFVVPSLQYDASSLDVYDGRRRVGRLGYSATLATIGFGHQFSNWGNVQLGMDWTDARVRALVPEGEVAAGGRFHDRAAYLQLQYDTLDSLALPSRGSLLQVRVNRSLGDGGTNTSAIGLTAFELATWQGHVYGEWARAHSGFAPLSLGGFLRLSGTPRGAVAAQRIALGRLVMARRIGQMPAGFGGAASAGFSLEFGNGFDAGESIRWGDLQQAGSVFVSVDTRFGPLFVGAGATRHRGHSLYLFLGPFW